MKIWKLEKVIKDSISLPSFKNNLLKVFVQAISLSWEYFTGCVCYFSLYMFSFATSFLPALVVGKETLVAAGHVTTQNLGGRKIC